MDSADELVNKAQAWDADRMLPIPMNQTSVAVGGCVGGKKKVTDEKKAKPSPLPWSAQTHMNDIRGMLNWKIRDPVDDVSISVYMMHSLGLPLLKQIKVDMKQRIIILTDDIIADQDVPTDLPKEITIFPARRFLYDHASHHYNLMAQQESMTDDEVQQVLTKYDINAHRHPSIYQNDPLLQYFYCFHTPKMISIPRPSVNSGMADYFRVVISQPRNR